MNLEQPDIDGLIEQFKLFYPTIVEDVTKELQEMNVPQNALDRIVQV